MKASIEDVARQAGVSTATVSRAFSRPDMVSAKTRAKVMEAAQQLDFSVSRMAGILKSGRSHRVALLVGSSKLDWFTSRIIEGLNEVLRSAGYDLVIQPIGDAGAREEFFDELPVRGNADAALAAVPEGANAVALRVQVKAARRLRGVEDEQKAVLARKSADAGYVQRVAGEIGGVRADDRAGVRPQRAGEIGIIDAAARIGAQKRDLHALLFQPVERAEHAVVLEIGRNHVVAGPEKPENGGVECLGRVLREAHARRVRPAEKGAELFARGVYHARGGKRALARAAADVAQRAQRLAHRAHHALRTAERCGGVVEIDHGFTTRSACVSFSTMSYMFVTPPTASCSVRP